MPEVDVMDMTWIGADRAAIAIILGQSAQWRQWWPELDLAVAEWRGALGVRWTVLSGHRGRMAGSMEIYLHPADDGTVGYYFLRLDGTCRPVPIRQRAGLVRRYRFRAKALLWAVGDRVDPDRLARVVAPAQEGRR